MEEDKLNKIKYKELTERFDNTQSQIRKIIEKIDVGTWKWNIQTGEVFLSDRSIEIIGYSKEELGPINLKTLESMTHPDDYKKSRELLEKHFTGELSYYKYESRVKHRNGHFVWICERGCITEYTPDGKPLIMFGTHTDITKKKEIEQALEDYINILNHDLRSPLSIIIGYSSYLQEEELSIDDIKKFSTIINSTGKKMLKMMESYLALAKIERGQDILGKNPKTVAEIINEIKKNFSDLNITNKYRILLKNLVDEHSDVNLMQKSVLIDEILFDSLISNLVRNAVDASLKTEDEIVVNIYEEEGLCISFLNTGEIPKEIQKRLFRKFISSKRNGTGMGLYSARLIARAHGGDIIYQFIPGGTRFILKIPFS